MSRYSVWREPEFDDHGVEFALDPPTERLSPWDQWRANETTGKYATEDDAKLDFIAHVRDDHWDVDQEVGGEVVFPKPGCRATTVRVDYVLWPKKTLVESGWGVGPICVEVKRSGVKLGPVICQAQDYMRCVLNGPNGLKFRPQFCVIFPLARVGEAVQSIMSDARIGHAHIGEDGLLRIYLNGQKAYGQRGGIFLRSALKSGNKFGSRSTK